MRHGGSCLASGLALLLPGRVFSTHWGAGEDCGLHACVALGAALDAPSWVGTCELLSTRWVVLSDIGAFEPVWKMSGELCVAQGGSRGLKTSWRAELLTAPVAHCASGYRWEG